MSEERSDYHSKRAMQEFHAGMTAESHEASEAHLRLSSLHMSRANGKPDGAAARRRDAPPVAKTGRA